MVAGSDDDPFGYVALGNWEGLERSRAGRNASWVVRVSEQREELDARWKAVFYTYWRRIVPILAADQSARSR